MGKASLWFRKLIKPFFKNTYATSSFYNYIMFQEMFLISDVRSISYIVI